MAQKWVNTGITCPGCGEEMEVSDDNPPKFRHANTKREHC